MTKKLEKFSPPEYDDLPLQEETNYFYTFDLGVAAALTAKGFGVVSLDKVNPRKVQFIFFRTADVESVVEDYWADRLEVKAQTFFNCIKRLKNQIYSQ